MNLFRVSRRNVTTNTSLGLRTESGSFNGVDVHFKTDSGRLTIVRNRRGLDGKHLVFMTGNPPGPATTRGHIVVQGRFHLEP